MFLPGIRMHLPSSSQFQPSALSHPSGEVQCWRRFQSPCFLLKLTPGTVSARNSPWIMIHFTFTSRGTADEAWHLCREIIAQTSLFLISFIYLLNEKIVSTSLPRVVSRNWRFNIQYYFRLFQHDLGSWNNVAVCILPPSFQAMLTNNHMYCVLFQIHSLMVVAVCHPSFRNKLSKMPRVFCKELILALSRLQGPAFFTFGCRMMQTSQPT